MNLGNIIKKEDEGLKFRFDKTELYDYLQTRENNDSDSLDYDLPILNLHLKKQTDLINSRLDKLVPIGHEETEEQICSLINKTLEIDLDNYMGGIDKVIKSFEKVPSEKKKKFLKYLHDENDTQFKQNSSTYFTWTTSLLASLDATYDSLIPDDRDQFLDLFELYMSKLTNGRPTDSIEKTEALLDAFKTFKDKYKDDMDQFVSLNSDILMDFPQQNWERLLHLERDLIVKLDDNTSLMEATYLMAGIHSLIPTDHFVDDSKGEATGFFLKDRYSDDVESLMKLIPSSGDLEELRKYALMVRTIAEDDGKAALEFITRTIEMTETKSFEDIIHDAELEFKFTYLNPKVHQVVPLDDSELWYQCMNSIRDVADSKEYQEVFNNEKKLIIKNMDNILDITGSDMNYIDLGPGNGIKTGLVIKNMEERTNQVSPGRVKTNLNQGYCLVDILDDILDEAESKVIDIAGEVETTKIKARFEELGTNQELKKFVSQHYGGGNIYSLLGNTFCNFEPIEIMSMLEKLLKPNDFIMLGMEICPDEFFDIPSKQAELAKKIKSHYEGEMVRELSYDPLRAMGFEEEFDDKNLKYIVSFVGDPWNQMPAIKTEFEVIRTGGVTTTKNRHFKKGTRFPVLKSYKYKEDKLEDILAYGGCDVEFVKKEGNNALYLARKVA